MFTFAKLYHAVETNATLQAYSAREGYLANDDCNQMS